MKKVPRGTSIDIDALGVSARPFAKGLVSDDPVIRPILFRAPLRAANAAGAKRTTRRLIVPSNVLMKYGQFSGLEMEDARAVRTDDSAHLAVPCTYQRKQFRGGVDNQMQRRIVEVHSRVKVGHLFWDRPGRFATRKSSQMTLEVQSVDVGRIQDMSNDDALVEGVEYVQIPKRLAAHLRTPRGIFSWLWDSINGAGSWASNPWVWIYHYHVFPQNVDQMLEAWEQRRD